MITSQWKEMSHPWEIIHVWLKQTLHESYIVEVQWLHFVRKKRRRIVASCGLSLREKYSWVFIEFFL